MVKHTSNYNNKYHQYIPLIANMLYIYAIEIFYYESSFLQVVSQNQLDIVPSSKNDRINYNLQNAAISTEFSSLWRRYVFAR